MSNFYSKYSNALNSYNKPGVAEVKRQSQVDYYTDDDRKRSNFKPLIPGKDFEDKYGYAKQLNYNDAKSDRATGEPTNEYSRNKQVRQLYPSSTKYYSPYGGGYNDRVGYQGSSYDAAPSYEPYAAPHQPMPVPVAMATPQPAYYEHPAYTVPKYANQYEAAPHREFVSHDIYKPNFPNTHEKLRQKQTDYYEKKRAVVHGTAYSDRSLAEDSDNLNSRQQKRKGNFENFMKYTACRINYKNIVLIQALFRGAYVRKVIFPQKKQFHIASVRTVDSMIDHYIEDVYLPDLLLELLSKNKVYENFDLYSDENKILYEVRASYMDNVVRDMVKEIVKDTSDRIVNRYLKKRFIDKTDDERDPLRMVLNGIMDGVMKQQAQEIAKNAVQNLSLDYLIQSQFYSLLNRVWIPKQVEHTIVDSIEDVALEGVINETLDKLLRQEGPRIADEALEAEKTKQENEFLVHAYNEYVNR